MYRDGIGVNKDLEKTWYWYLKAVNNGAIWVSPELFDTAWALSNDEKYKEAVEWCFKDAETGNVHSMVRIGRAYVGGMGLTKNISEGLIWYDKAISNGADWAIVEYNNIK